MKIFMGCVLVMSGCLGMGVWYRNLLLERIRVLKELSKILYLFTRQIQFGRSTLSECCLRIAAHTESPFRDCLIQIYDETKESTGESFFGVAEVRFGELLDSLPITIDERKHFLKMIDREGYRDETSQLHLLEESKQSLDKVVCELAAGEKSRGKVYVSCGFLGGLFLIVLLL